MQTPVRSLGWLLKVNPQILSLVNKHIYPVASVVATKVSGQHVSFV